MKLKNTENPKKIKKRNIVIPSIAIGGAIVFSLAATLTLDNINESKETAIADSEEYLYYQGQYLNSLNNLNSNDFDQNFDNIYNDITFKYNGQEYPGPSLFIVEYDDGSTHLVYSDNNKVDLFTNEPITAKKAKIVAFRESSAFYKMYKDGLITSTDFELSTNIISYINSWDGEKHTATPDLAAEKEANEAYDKKYGGR